MNSQILEILRLVASFLTPLMLLFLGILLNKRLESNKSSIAKEKNWQEFWANKFLDVAFAYNAAITEFVTYLSQAKQISHEKLSGWEEEFKEKEKAVRLSIRKLQYLDWEIQNFIQFAPNKGENVKNKQKQLFDLVANLSRTQQGSLEEIRNIQFEFNDSVRLAHAEILEISHNKSFKQMR